MTYEEWDLIELENAVDYYKHVYIKARDAHLPSTELWNDYAQVLHAYRLRRRNLINANA